MSKFTRQNTKDYFRLLLEQEEAEDAPAEEPAEEEGGEETADDIFGGDEGGGGGAAGGEAAAEEGGEEAEAGADEPSEEVSDEDRDNLGKIIDDDLEALLVDFETQARKSKQLENEETQDVSESLGLRFLLESEYESELDVERFSSEVARLIKNYDNLLDMEALILAKARVFLNKRYGVNAADDMEQSLSSNHGIDIKEPAGKDDENAVPVAVGAGSGAAGE